MNPGVNNSCPSVPFSREGGLTTPWLRRYRRRYRRRSTSSFNANEPAKHASFIQYVLCHLSRLAATTYIAGDPLLSFTLIVNDDRHPVIGVSIYISYRITLLCGRSYYYLKSLVSAIRRLKCRR